MFNSFINCTVICAFLLASVFPSLAFSQQEEQSVVRKSSAPAAAKTVSTDTVKQENIPHKAKTGADTAELLSAVSGLNYKIEYLQSGYNRLNNDIETLRIADRDQKKLFNDRLSAIPLPDVSRLENLETESALMRSELSQVRADIADIKGRLAYRGEEVSEREKKDKILHSPWLAVGALGLALIALVAR